MNKKPKRGHLISNHINFVFKKKNKRFLHQSITTSRRRRNSIQPGKQPTNDDDDERDVDHADDHMNIKKETKEKKAK